MTKNKHDHTATKKIKAWLFAIMLLLPFLFIVPTAFYYGFNEQAQAQERIEQEPIYYQSNEISSNNDFVIGNAYFFTDNIVYDYETTGYHRIAIQSEEIEAQFNITINDNYCIFGVNGNTTNYCYIWYDNTYITISNQRFYFVYINSPITIENNLPNYVLEHIEPYYDLIKEYQQITYTMSITDSMSTAWTNTWSNPLFSWTNNSPFYTAMSNFTNVFGINNMQIANVLTYLATITAIYIVFDIIIELFTYLTHLIPRSD